MRTYWRKIAFGMVLYLISLNSWSGEMIWEGAAQERLGKFELHDFSLRPYFLDREGGSGTEFGMGESSLGLEWKFEEDLRARFRLGSQELLYRSARYSGQEVREIGFVEAYAEGEVLYGQWRMGLIPIPYGLDSQIDESQMVFPRPLFYRERIIGLRDFGASFGIDNSGFYNILSVHHGEGRAENTDNRMWYSATWGWTDEETHNVGFMGSAGTTKPISTVFSDDTLAGVDVGRSEKWRMGGLFFDRHGSKIRFSIQASLGSLIQEEEITNFSTGHMDWSLKLSNLYGMHFRYDFLDPNSSLSDDLKQEITLGLSHGTVQSKIYLFAKRVLEQKDQIPNDEIRLVWSVSPMVPAR